MERHPASATVRGVRLSRMIALLAATAAIWSASIAAGRCDAVADFYRGRSISLVIGFGAGGGYDAYARLLARHIGRHIPGNPSLVAQNMQGAGGLKATQAGVARGVRSDDAGPRVPGRGSAREDGRQSDAGS